jgi:hypothetical protein
MDSGEAHPDESLDHLSRYSYSSDQCADGTEVNPVNVVFTGGVVTSPFLRDHFDRHGGWANNVGANQHFRDHGDCDGQDDQAATGDWWNPVGAQDRIHARWEVADVNGEAEFAVGYGYQAVSTPHDEEWVLGCGGSVSTHATWDQYERPPFGGFVSARNEILNEWLPAADGHTVLEVQTWGNDMVFYACDGGAAWNNNGYVYIIHTPPATSGGLPPSRGF